MSIFLSLEGEKGSYLRNIAEHEPGKPHNQQPFSMVSVSVPDLSSCLSYELGSGSVRSNKRFPVQAVFDKCFIKTKKEN